MSEHDSHITPLSTYILVFSTLLFCTFITLLTARPDMFYLSPSFFDFGSFNIVIAMIIAFVGVCVMIVNDSISGTIYGALLGFLSATGFALYTVTIRWKPETPKFTTVVLAGLFCTIVSFVFLGLSFEPFETMPIKNSYLSVLHGLFVATGLILYSLGAKYLPSAELALLSLMEVVGGVLWVWLPIFGINETPSLTVIIGGLIITIAVIYHGYGSSRRREPILP